MNELDRALIGLVVLLGAALAYIVKQRRNGHSGPSATQLSLVQDMKDHVSEAERRIQKNVDDTRHALKNDVQNMEAGIITEIKERRTRGRP